MATESDMMDSGGAMRIHYLQHVIFEGPAAIEDWARQKGHTVTGSHLYRGDPLPGVSAFDLLVMMGGPMSVNDEHEHPWLLPEKQLVRKAVQHGRAVFGVCLGAQLIASALGASVYQAPEREIGWFPVRRVTGERIGALLPQRFTPLHWHGETFDLPAGAVRLAETDAVPNQAFQFGDNVVGLQFHMEATPQSVEMLVENAGQEIQEGQPFQQPPQIIVAQAPEASAAVRPVLWKLLDHLVGAAK
ncbi:MAG TPA: type 1 glutamine amidotransferase [Pseudacidobacterium sp.]|nr:type 1 glutamine amidotransferase [Pseudacidobacterium sp.]